MKAKIARWLLLILVLGFAPIVYNNCSGAFTSATSPLSGSTVITATYSPPLPIAGTEANVLPVSVGCGYMNEPCVSVTICQPGGAVGSSQCVTVPDILVDTGSFGLRVFSSVLSFGLNVELDPASGNPVAECFGYAGGNSDWGPVAMADVVLGNGQERAANIPIQVIDSTYAQIPGDCTTPDTSPSEAGYNGILGVGLLIPDCGDTCSGDAGNRVYFACSSAGCNSIAMADNMQVINPVSAVPQDNNGVIMQFANMGPLSTAPLNGYLIMGIGTQTDNTPPAGVTVMSATSNSSFSTFFGGQYYSTAFIDSGSNAVFFPDTTLVPCGGSEVGFYCPQALTSLSATQVNAGGNVEVPVPFYVVNATTGYSTNNAVIPGLAGSAPDYFDWGFPFFIGKTTYVGFDGKSSTLGAGPLWGF